MILDLLENSKKTKSLIGFNFYGSETGFYCGYVLEFNDDVVIIQHFSKFGMTDGILVHKISEIQYFETDTDYLNGIQLLSTNQNIIHEQTYKLTQTNNKLESFTHLFESFIGDRDYLIKFELTDDEVYFGFIGWCDEDCFSIINIDNDGITIGKAIFKLEDLKVYWIDDLESRKRKFLYETKNASS